MNIWTFFRNLLSYKLFAVIVLGYLIPQMVYLAVKLTWALTIIIAVFLSCELLIVLIVRVWLPHRVNVPQIMEWTITTLLRVSSSLFSVFCQVLYSCFDLLFGRVLQTGQRRNSQYRKQIELRYSSLHVNYKVYIQDIMNQFVALNSMTSKPFKYFVFVFKE